jgi:hypothetical protein
MMQLQIKQINTQGQISFGKKFAGQKVQVEEYPDGSVVLTPVEIIPTFELDLMKDQILQKRLLKYDKWVSDHQPVQSNLNQLTK